MRKMLMIFSAIALFYGGIAFGSDGKQSMEFSNSNGLKSVRIVTPNEGYSQTAFDRQLPIRNPHILSQVVWVDRNHENAIANDVAVSPDGASIFAGWWLNNMRFASYVSAGLDAPLWRYNVTTQWQMPVSARANKYAGTGSSLPALAWGNDSPLYQNSFNYDAGYIGASVSLSGNGELLAAASWISADDAILTVYDLGSSDTIFVRHFVPTQGLQGVDFSRDGSRVLVTNYGGLLVYSVPNGDLLGQLPNYSQTIAKISGDGNHVVSGSFTGAVEYYNWDGSSYVRRWIRATGHDWVTAVAISADGSTFACGTLDFVNGQIAGGKFEMWDASNGNTLIDYRDYGDEVGSVALSADGRYAIAGCWGAYARTYGDVVTVFIRDTDVPIFQLLDDIDEPGSIFGVAISDSGNYAAAGGKAVHARDWGNGGMLYSIKINDPVQHDVAVSSIDAPGELVNPGDTFSPTATFINVGLETESFTANCKITDMGLDTIIYESSYNINSLMSFGTSQVYFEPPFTLQRSGRYRIDFSALLPTDMDTANNTLSLTFRSWHDIKAISVTNPFNEATVNWSGIPSAIFKNFGSYDESVDVTLSIFDSTGIEVYTSIANIFGLSPYASEEVHFDPWIPDLIGTFRAVFNAEVPDDASPEDNTITKYISAVQEMMYDDGQFDATYWVGSYPDADNRKFLQVFDPNVSAPFTIENVRFYQPPTAYDGYLDYLAIALDVNDLPDTLDYLAKIPFPELAGPGQWSGTDLNVHVQESTPLWVILHWPDEPLNGPFIGADATGLINCKSWWFSNTGGYNSWPFNDWMIRMTLQSATGVESDYLSGLPNKISLMQNYPNPFNPTTTIKFAMPVPGNARIEIFNSLGQRVKLLADSHFDTGYHSIVWDGKNDVGISVSSGMYYYRLTAGDANISRKMLMLK